MVLISSRTTLIESSVTFGRDRKGRTWIQKGNRRRSGEREGKQLYKQRVQTGKEGEKGRTITARFPCRRCWFVYGQYCQCDHEGHEDLPLAPPRSSSDMVTTRMRGARLFRHRVWGRERWDRLIFGKERVEEEGGLDHGKRNRANLFLRLIICVTLPTFASERKRGVESRHRPLCAGPPCYCSQKRFSVSVFVYWGSDKKNTARMIQADMLCPTFFECPLSTKPEREKKSSMATVWLWPIYSYLSDLSLYFFFYVRQCWVRIACISSEQWTMGDQTTGKESIYPFPFFLLDDSDFLKKGSFLERSCTVCTCARFISSGI